MSAALRMAMAKHQITSKALTLETGLSSSSISKIINGRQKPSADNCYLITDAICDLSGKRYHVDTIFPHLSKKNRYAN